MSTKCSELTSYCGLYCGDCFRHISETPELSNKFLVDLFNYGWGKYDGISSNKAFQNYRQCFDVLEAIIERRCEDPCRNGGGCKTFKCKIIQCCMMNGFEGCWECWCFEDCERLEFLKPFHGDTITKNLHKIKELGLDNWAGHRYKFYVWQ